ncbi:hypothetical protein Patl1_16489 [Pistacia atlantica]|uniref:Uncharacterized protein n=1 Tax=Pistacia atlantica TaxID=434234 RepID=A0ACC1B7U3_9ROSI|nr:hypothetical protein Patl1_16489 [Pistacia atlantica]
MLSKLVDFEMLQQDDWVLCRIYRKSHLSSPTSNAAASDQEEEQFIQDTLLPILKSPPNHSTLRLESAPMFTSGILDQPVFNNGTNSSGHRRRKDY